MSNVKYVSSALGKATGIRTIGPFKGVSDRAGATEDGACEYLEYSENMWRDPENDGEISTFPGFRRLTKDPLGVEIQSRTRLTGGDTLLAADGTLYIFEGEDYSVAAQVIALGSSGRISVVATARGFIVFDGTEPRLFTKNEGGVYEEVDSAVHIPTFRRGGVWDKERVEERNLLTDLVFEETSAGKKDILRPTRSLRYSAIRRSGVATVSGMDTADSIVYIPSSVTIDGLVYKVKYIESDAFKDRTTLKMLVIGKDVSVLPTAFRGCTGLEFVAFETPSGEGQIQIGERAFEDCPIKSLYLADKADGEGKSLVFLSEKAFGESMCSDATVYYGESETCYGSILGDGASALPSAEDTRVVFGHPYENRYDFYYAVVGEGDILEVEEIFCEGESLPFGSVYRNTTDPETVRYVLVYLPVDRSIEDQLLVARCRLTPLVSDGGDLLEALKRSRVACGFDGRLFVSGGEVLPDTVFYSAESAQGYDPWLYFPVTNQLKDGANGIPVTCMIASPSMLVVLKDGDGGAYIHRAGGGSGGYRSDEGAFNVGCDGAGLAAFFRGGFCTVSRGRLIHVSGTRSGEKTVRVLLGESRTESEITRLAVFGSYLAASVRGGVVLVDGESLDGDCVSAYRLCDLDVRRDAVAEFIPCDPDCDEALYALLDGTEVPLVPYRDIFDGTVGAFSTDKVFSSVLWRKVDGKLEAVSDSEVDIGVYTDMYSAGAESVAAVSEPSGGLCGGTPDPLSRCYSDGERLFFVTEGGEVCVFNTDRRGVQCYRYDVGYSGGELVGTTGESLLTCEECEPWYSGEVARLECFDATGASVGTRLCTFDGTGRIYPLCEPERAVGEREIHPAFYSFDGRAIYSFAVTGRDRMGEVACAKTTVRGGVVLALGKASEGPVTVRVRTDREGFFTVARVTPASLDLSSCDFGACGFDTDKGLYFALIDERCRGYMWRQYHFSSYGIYKPFGISMLSTRYLKRRYKGQ